MSICKNCGHECNHSDGGSCHCGCADCKHDVQEAINKLNKVLTLTGDSELEVVFESDFSLTEHQEVNMKLVKDVIEWLKEWNDWNMKDWIKAGFVCAIVLVVLWKMGGA